MNKVYHISEQINTIGREKTKRIEIKGATSAKLLFAGIFCREKSINQIMEKVHKRNKYKNLFSRKEKLPKMHGFRDGIKDLKLEDLERINKNIIMKAKENKKYRQGTIDNLVVVAIDGVTTFGSYKKDWDNSYKKLIKNQKYINNEKCTVEEEYHEQINVMAKIVGKRPGLMLGYEKVTCNGNEGKQEYEPNVAQRLIRKLKNIYGRGIDVIVFDAIYLNESILNTLEDEKYVGVIRLKDNQKTLLENANGTFKLQKANKIKLTGVRKKKLEKIEYWSDVFEFKKRKIKIVKYIEMDKNQNKKEVFVMCTDINMSEDTINKIIHDRWDIENEGFNELKNQWNMKHCYMADEKGIDVILQIILMSYNLWELYLYGHLHEFEKLGMTKIGYMEMVQETLFTVSYKTLGFSSA